MQIGRRIYFDKISGDIVHDTGEREGNVLEVSIETELTSYPALAGKTLSNVGVIELTYGERREEISNMQSWHVDPGTKQLIIVPQPQV